MYECFEVRRPEWCPVIGRVSVGTGREVLLWTWIVVVVGVVVSRRLLGRGKLAKSLHGSVLKAMDACLPKPETCERI